MIWLQSGAAKSGNLWLYNVLQSIARHGGIPQKSFIRRQPIHAIAKDWPLSFPGQADIDTLSINPHQCLYRISGIFNMPIADLDAYLADCSHVWTQSYFWPSSEKVFSKFDKVVYIVRDPRDVLISMSRFTFTPYRLKYFPQASATPEEFLEANLVESTRAWVRHVSGHLREAERLNIHIILYERLLKEFRAELDRLLAYLGVSLDEAAIAKVIEDSRFETMRGTSPQHVRKGESSQWGSVLNGRQIAAVEKIAGPLLKRLNYPITKKDLEKEALPSLAKMDAQTCASILKHSERQVLFEKLRAALFGR